MLSRHPVSFSEKRGFGRFSSRSASRAAINAGHPYLIVAEARYLPDSFQEP